MTSNGRLTTDDLIRLIEQKTGRPARKVGKEWAMLCPHHETLESKTPSLHVRDGDAGYPILNCRSQGCSANQILSSLDLTWADVFGNDDEHWMPNNRTWIALYDYRNADGTLEYQVARAADKNFSQRRPDPDNPGKWKWNLTGTKRVPYRLPEVLASPDADVWVAEGEKDVQALEAMGLLATCNSGGAGKWQQEFARYFTGRNIVIAPDHDPPGHAHAIQVYENLAPVAASVRIVITPAGKDPADHLAAGLGPDDFTAIALDQLRPSLEPEKQDTEAPAETVRRAELRFLPGSAFVNQPVSNIEPLLGPPGAGLLVPGGLLLLAGIGGAGKTTLSLHALLHLCAGIPWLDVQVQRPLKAVLIENEGPHDLFVEKLKRMCDRFHDCPCGGEPHGDGGEGFMQNATVLDTPWGHFSFDDPGYANELADHATAFEADLVMANPVGRLGIKGAGTPEETRDFLSLLVRAGLGDLFAAWLIHHMAKGKQMSLSQQISGDWSGHPDTILILESAGAQRSKLIFDKNRWGKQGDREPALLNWLVDDDGPVGYSLADAPKGVTDDEVYERIDAFLREAPEPPTMTAVQQGITGQHKRLKQLVDAGVAVGRYGCSTGKRKTYWLAGDGPEQEAMEL